MSVFSMNSDKFLIRTKENSDIIHVYEYSYKLYLRETYPPEWRFLGTVDESSNFKVLEVFGVEIKGETLRTLTKELSFFDEATRHKLYPYVNRQGLCLKDNNTHPAKLYRINGYFDWSKYGVTPPNSTGVVLLDRSEGKCGSCDNLMKALGEKDEELASLKAASKNRALK